jgi:hypothetical protein
LTGEQASEDNDLTRAGRSRLFETQEVSSMRRKLALVALAAGAMSFVVYGTVEGAPQALPFNLPGGGPGGSGWFLINDGGTDNGLPTGGMCEGDPGLTVADATLDTSDTTAVGIQTDAYDNAAMLWLDDVVFIAPEPVDVTGQTMTAGPVAMSGLNVTMQYYAASGSATLRTLISFQNPSGAAINATAAWVNNHGSDGSTIVQGTSTSDTTFATDDRWIVTSDSATDPSDPVNTYVLFGPGSPAETPATASLDVFSCAGTQGVLGTFDVTIPAGSTRHLMFFNQLNQTNAEGLAGAAMFDTNPAEGGDLLGGLTQQQLSEALNWAFGAAPPVDTPTEPAPTGAAPTSTQPGPTATVDDTITAPGTGSAGPDSGSPVLLLAALGALSVTIAGAGAFAYARRR